MHGRHRGFVDGDKWFDFSGGADENREYIPYAPSMHQTFRLDHFHGEDLQSALYEIDWARVYALPDDENAG